MELAQSLPTLSDILVLLVGVVAIPAIACTLIALMQEYL